MILKSIVIPSAIYCTDVDCKHAGHTRDIDTYYDNICDTLVVVSRKHTPSSTFKCSSDYIVPGFNNNNIFIHTCYNCIEQYIPINNNILRIIKHVMLNI